jgi:hypothetical protein
MVSFRWRVAAVAALFFMAFLFWRNAALEQEIAFLNQARRIDGDQIRELMYAVQIAGQQTEGDRTRAYLAGLSDAHNRPELNAVWHSGYDRGMSVGVESARVENARVETSAGQEALTDAR